METKMENKQTQDSFSFWKGFTVGTLISGIFLLPGNLKSKAKVKELESRLFQQTKVKEMNGQRRKTVWEFYDKNHDRLYDSYTLFIEQGENREIYLEGNFRGDYTKEEVYKTLPQGDEFRFLEGE